MGVNVSYAQYPEDGCGCFLEVDGTLVPEAIWRVFDGWYGDKSYRHVDLVNEMYRAAIRDIQSQLDGEHFPTFWDIPFDYEPEIKSHDYL